MRFNVAGRWFPVVDVDGLVKNDRGEVGLACAFLNPRRIEVSSACTPEFRPDVILQAVQQAWRLEQPSLDMACEQTQSRIHARAMEDVQAQGGIEALRLGSVASGEQNIGSINRTITGPPAERLQCCQKCEQRISPHQVKMGAPRLDPEFNKLVVDLAFWCDGCSELSVWAEESTRMGPNGVPVGEPRYLRFKDAEPFLRANADAVGFVLV